MYQVKCLNKISKVGTSRFSDQYTCGDAVENPHAILVRSAAMHDMELPSNLLAIARAGAGTNNIPVDKCSEQGIVVFNTPGANANAVKELVLAALFLSSRKIDAGIAWAQGLKGQGAEVGKLVEKGKSAFAGPEIQGKTLGVIGLGAIGIRVANAAAHLGMKVYGYDPFLSVEAAWGLERSIHHALSLDDIYANCDYISLHVPLTPDTKGMINKETLARMKDPVRILNFARGDLVNNEDLLACLGENGKVACYVTDFPSDDLLGVEGVLPIPHLGASTPESEDNCARMAANEIRDYLEWGNIRNSVNMPEVVLSPSAHNRICIINRNVPNMVAKIASKLGECGINIENMANKARGNHAYTIVETNDTIDAAAIEEIRCSEGIIRVRVIHFA